MRFSVRKTVAPQPFQSAILMIMFLMAMTHAFSIVPPTTSRKLVMPRHNPQTSAHISIVGRRQSLVFLAKSKDKDEKDDDGVFFEWQQEDYQDNEDQAWKKDEDFRSYELEDDDDDENYMKQKQLVQASLKAKHQIKKEESFDALDYIMNEMTDKEIANMEALSLQKDTEARAEGFQLTEEDLQGMDMDEIAKKVEETTDIVQDPAYPIFQPDEEDILKEDINITNQDMIDLENAWKHAQETLERPLWEKVTAKDEDPAAWAALSNETLDEMEDCLLEIGGSPYNCTRWLLYDLDFNVTNLMLAAVQHNRKAPILFQHWYPQLLTYSRYKSASDRNFDFTWQDVENADITELQDYYRGMGYDDIPTKAPSETGIISLEDLDEEEIRMAALENWMADVYNPEMDRLDFDDDAMRDENNVFSQYYEEPEHPDKPTYEETLEDLNDWDEEMEDGDEQHKKYMGRDYKYKVVVDEDFQREFRGHLVVCCTADDSDLEIAEKITKRMAEEYGKQVFVETRVTAHARQEDNVFEVWLESYEVDLLHSKRRASMNAKGWEGPAECDDTEIEYLVKEVGFLISDDQRYSYRYDLEMAE